MIGIVYEDMIIRTAVHNFPATPGDSSFVSKDSGKEVTNSNIFPSVILQPQSNNHHKSTYSKLKVNTGRRELQTLGTPL